MKKRIAILLSLVMALAFAFAACGGGGDVSDSKYVGTWSTGEVVVVGESSELDDVYTLTLNDDGTGTLTGGEDEVSEFTWQPTSKGLKTKGDVNLKFEEDGDAIKTSFLGVELRFVRAEEGGEEVVDQIDGGAYGYAGDDPVEAACYAYMVETVGKSYDAADVSIPSVQIVHMDLTPEDEVLVYGDFWVYNYNIEGDTLKCVSGGNYPGCMHVSKADNTVTAFDQVADGGEFESSAQEIFGEHYDDFMAVYSDEDARAENRKVTVSDYVNLNGLTEVTKMQDEGWDPVDLYVN